MTKQEGYVASTNTLANAVALIAGVAQKVAGAAEVEAVTDDAVELVGVKIQRALAPYGE